MRSILILDAFITDDEDEKLLNNFLDSSKSFGDEGFLYEEYFESSTLNRIKFI